MKRFVMGLAVAGSVVGLRPEAWALQKAAELSLSADDVVITAAVLDTEGRYAYVATAPNDFPYSLEQAAASVVKVSLNPFQAVSRLRLEPGETPARTSLFDPGHNALYLGVYGDPNRAVPARVVKVGLAPLKREGYYLLDKEQFGIGSALLDPKGEYGYFGTLYGEVVAVRLADLSLSGSVGFQREDNALASALLDPGGGYAYFGTLTGNLLQIRLADFSPVATLSLFRNGIGLQTVFQDDRGGTYWGTRSSPGRLVKVSLKDLKVGNTLTLDPGEDDVVAALYDRSQDKAYLCLGSRPAKIVVVRLSDMTREETFSLPLSDGLLSTAVLNSVRHELWLGMGSNPAKIVRVKL